MVDHIRTLLLNQSGVSGYKHVTDDPADSALALFGLTGDGSESDARIIDTLMPIVLCDDLVTLRRFFDDRVTPDKTRTPYSSVTLSPYGLYSKVLTGDGWWRLSSLFAASDPSVLAVLSEFRKAASCSDAPFAIGAVLIACAYRRMILQEGIE